MAYIYNVMLLQRFCLHFFYRVVISIVISELGVDSVSCVQPHWSHLNMARTYLTPTVHRKMLMISLFV